ncbi:MAG: hypothetical protein AAF530_20510 [Pseudomonadota bacterium]
MSTGQFSPSASMPTWDIAAVWHPGHDGKTRWQGIAALLRFVNVDPQLIFLGALRGEQPGTKP